MFRNQAKEAFWSKLNTVPVGSPICLFCLEPSNIPFVQINHLAFKLSGTVLSSTTACRLLHKAPGLLYFSLLVIKPNKLFQ